jgi:ferredoxin-like protein FixX
MSEHPPFPADFLNLSGLNRQHVFSLESLPAGVLATLGDTSGYGQLILLGDAGRLRWECVKAGGIDGEHPIDDYSVQTVNRWFADFLPGRRYAVLYPGEQMVGLQQLGRLAGWHQPSPFMLGIDSEWGSWFAYRAAILADTDFLPFLPLERKSPCASCQGQPCITVCPAGAMADGRFSMRRCADYRLQPDSACAYRCLARLACPVGSAHRYDEEQLRHSYSRSLEMLRHGGQY